VTRHILLATALLAGCAGELDEDDPIEGDGVEPTGVDDSTGGEDGEALASFAIWNDARVTGTGGVGLNLRSGPGSGYSALVVMPEGAIAGPVTAKSGAWYKLKYCAGTCKTGWAHSDWLVRWGWNYLLPYDAGTARTVTCGYGCGGHTNSQYYSRDFGMPNGTKVRASHSGYVRKVRNTSTNSQCGCSSAWSNYANYVALWQEDGTESVYLHLSSVSVSVGQWVHRGDVVGYSGQSGWTCGGSAPNNCGPHLHTMMQVSPGRTSTATAFQQTLDSGYNDLGYWFQPTAGNSYTSQNRRSNNLSREAEEESVAIDEPELTFADEEAVAADGGEGPAVEAAGAHCVGHAL
jgi:murein DD-endopeptidase MepM/ murein hydrolase activator NlpD